MSNRFALISQVQHAMAIGDGTLIRRLIDFLGSDQFAAIVALIAKLFNKGGASVASSDESAFVGCGVNFGALEAALSGAEYATVAVSASSDIVDVAAQRLADNYVGFVGEGVGVMAFEIGGIMKLIELVMGFVKNCMAQTGQKPTPAAAAQTVNDARRDSRLFRFAVTRRLKHVVIEDRGRDGWRELRGDGIVDTVIKTAAESSPEEMQAFMSKVYAA